MHYYNLIFIIHNSIFWATAEYLQLNISVKVELPRKLLHCQKYSQHNTQIQVDKDRQAEKHIEWLIKIYADKHTIR